MNPTLKATLLTLPALLAAAPILADAPATQPAAVPSTQPTIAQSNAPLVIPDGTSPQNPGPAFVNNHDAILQRDILQIQQIQIQQAQPQAQPMVVFGLRG